MLGIFSFQFQVQVNAFTKKNKTNPCISITFRQDKNKKKYKNFISIFYLILNQILIHKNKIKISKQMIARVIANSTIRRRSKLPIVFINSIRFHFSNLENLRTNIYKIIDAHGFQSQECQKQLQTLVREMNEHFKTGNLREGIEYYKINVELIEKSYGQEAKETMLAKSLLGSYYVKGKMFKEAIETFEEVRQYMVQHQENKNTEFVNVVYNIGFAHKNLGNKQKMKQTFLEVERLMNEAKVNDLNAVAVQYDLAKIDIDDKNHESALQRYRKCSKLLREYLKAHPEVKNLQSINYILVEAAKCESNYGDKHKAVEIMKHIQIGEVKQQKLLLINAATEVQLDIGMLDEAQNLLEDSVGKLPRKFHSVLLANLAKVYLRKNQPKKGEEVCNRFFLTVKEERIVLDPVFTAGMLSNLAKFQHNLSKVEECLETLKKSLEIYEKLNKQTFTHKDQIKTLDQIASLNYRYGNLDQSQKYYIKIVNLVQKEDVKKIVKDYLLKSRISMEMLTNICIRKKNFQKALEYALQADREFQQDQNNRLQKNVVVRIKNTIAMLYRNLNKPVEAYIWLQKYKTAVEKYSNKNDLIYVEYLQIQGRKSETSEQYQDAQKLYSKAGEIIEKLAEDTPQLASHTKYIKELINKMKDKIKTNQ